MAQKHTTPDHLDDHLQRATFVPLVGLSIVAVLAIFVLLAGSLSALSVVQSQIRGYAVVVIAGICIIWGVAIAWSIIRARRMRDEVVVPIRKLSSALRKVELTSNAKGVSTEPTTIQELLELYQAIGGIIRELATVRQLNQRLAEANESKEDVAAEVARLQIESERDSLTDALTQVSNRRCLERDLPNAMDNADKSGVPLCFAMCDIDHFKHFNDTYGHQTGDEVLAHFAEILREGFRGSDHVYRYGGEEFGVILRKASLEQANAACDRIREQVAKSFLERNLEVTASFGVAMYAAGIPTPEVLVSHADKALYEAKENGRNRVEMYVPGENGNPDDQASEPLNDVHSDDEVTQPSELPAEESAENEEGSENAAEPGQEPVQNEMQES